MGRRLLLQPLQLQQRLLAQGAGAGAAGVAPPPPTAPCGGDRPRRMGRPRQQQRGSASAAITRQAYLSEEIQIGAIVGWIFNNEQEGYRIK